MTCWRMTGAVIGVLTALAGLGACDDARPAATLTPAPSSTPAAARSPSPTPSPSATGVATPTATHTAVPAPHPVVPANWIGPIYPPHLHGYDLSYPQCSGGQPPSGAAFSIVGVNGGKGFTVNACALAQWQSARGMRALYFNSGYEPANAGRSTSDCSSRSRYQQGGAERQTAYAIGCSEAVFAENWMNAFGAGRTPIIWLDVESANSWDPSNLDLNHVALQAEIDQLAAFGHLVGIYATFSEWHLLMGSWAPDGVVADWVAGQTPQRACGAPGFTGQPVWLAQELDTWPGSGLDSDWTC